METQLKTGDTGLSARNVNLPDALPVNSPLISDIAGVETLSNKFALGNILVAASTITPAQLEGALLRQVESGRLLGEELISTGHASKRQIEVGLLLQSKLIACALAVLAGLAPLSSAAEAAQKNTAMPVSVTVIANARIQSSYQATQLKISEADVARGYIEIPVASRFSVTTNSRSGYILEFHPVLSLFDSVQIDGLPGSAVQLGAEGGNVVQRGPLPQNLTHELSFRFTLRQDALPGNYPWPLLLSVRAL